MATSKAKAATQSKGDSKPAAQPTHVFCEFTRTRGVYKEGSTHRLDSALARHYVEVEKAAKVVKAPEAANRKHPGAEGGGGLSTKNGPGSSGG